MTERDGTPPLTLGRTILHVPDVARSISFYGRAFGLTRGSLNRLGAHDRAAAAAFPSGFEIAPMADAALIEAAGQRAIQAGAVSLRTVGGHALGTGRGLRPRP